MGDVIMSIFAISALRKAYPDLRIIIATKRRFAGFYREIQDAEILTLDEKGSLKSLFALVARASREGVA